MDPLFELLPLESQRSLIQSAVDAREARLAVREAAGLVRDSGLPTEEKRELYHQLIQRAAGDQVARLGIAVALVPLDPEWALEILWPTIKPGKDPDAMGYHDWVDMVGTLDRPASARDALSIFGVHHTVPTERLTIALWSFSENTQGTDRDAVLAALGDVLLRSGDAERALGVVRLVQRQPWRVELTPKIAAQLHSP